MFHKDTFRLIKKTGKRFVTILLIVMIGVAFMVGLMSCEPTMLASVDKYYRETNFMDLQLYSSYGFDDRDVRALEKSENVKYIFPTKFTDVFAKSGESQIVTRIQEIDSSVNRITVTEGRMPSAPNEAVALGSSSFGKVFEIGDAVEVYLEDGDLSESLAVTEYTIVGIAKTPQYMSSSKETSNLNNLNLSAVLFVDSANFLNDYYTSLYVVLEGRDDFESFTESYEEFVSDSVDRLEKIIKKREVVRRDEIIQKVTEEIADGEKELLEKTADAQKKIDDGKKELEEAYIRLIVAEAQISQSETQIKTGEAEIAANERLLNSSRRQIAQSKNQITEQAGTDTYEQAAASIEGAYTALSMYNTILANIDDTYMSMTPAQASASMQAEAAGLRNTNSGLQAENAAKSAENLTKQAEIENCNRRIEEISNDAAKTEEEKRREIALITPVIGAAQAVIDANNQAIEENNAAIEENNTKIFNLEGKAAVIMPLGTAYPGQTLGEIKTSVNSDLTEATAAHNAIAQITSGEAQIAIGKAQLESAKSELETGKAQLEQAKRKISSGRTDYEKGLKDLEKGQEELDKEKEKAEIDLAKARQDLEELPDAKWIVLDRNSHYSTYMYDNNSEQMGKIGTVFPMLFFLVAALVCMTTMKRLVDEERSQIGVFSALGFSKGKITSKYVIYALTASLLGSVAAIPIGIFIFPGVIYFCWKLMYDLPEMVLTMPLSVAALGVCSFTLLMIGVTYIVVRGVLKENPSRLMRPKAPKTAKKIFLEHIPFIWKRLSFTSKVTARNIIRYKSRFFMTVIGVAGCTSLLVLGFSIKGSISQVVSIQYGDIIKYETTATLEPDTKADSLIYTLKNDENVECAVPMLTYSSKVYFDGEESTIHVYVTDRDSIEDIIDLRERASKKPLSIKNGVVISEKFSRLYGIKEGDEITIESSNGIKRAVKVSGICEMYTQHYLFIDSENYTDIFGESVRPNNIAIKSYDSGAVMRAYKEYDGVKSIYDFTAMKETFNNMFDSLNIIILVIIIAAGSLALVVIMNLTEVNISERIREIATLKVLGFNNKEVYAYIFKEVFILSLIGMTAGLPLGRLELIYVMGIIDMEMVMFSTVVQPSSYILGAAITMIFTVFVIMLMRKTLRNVQMVESLKSVE